MLATPDILGLLIATLGGTAIGLERQWSGHADGPSARFGGLRTFTMLGALAGISGWFLSHHVTAAAVALLSGAVVIISVAYLSASRNDVDATTEIAALVVLAAGVMAGLGHHQLASAIIALESLLLVEKSRLHALVKRIDEVGLRAGIRFGVLALVVLPLLPLGPFGPFGGIRPRTLWALVLFFSGLSFAGFIARRVVGPSRGYLITGLLAGLVSSTSATLTFARSSRLNRTVGRDLAFGAIAANAMLYPRILVALTVLNPALLIPTARYVALPALVALCATTIGLLRAPTGAAPQEVDRNPLQLSAALQMAVLFQGVLMGVHVVQRWGAVGVLTSAAVLGLTDVDALTLSMARETAPNLSVGLAALAIAVGITANTILKLAVCMFFGSARFRATAGLVLALMLVAAAVSVVYVGMTRSSLNFSMR